MNLYITKSGILKRKDNTLMFEIFELDEEKELRDVESEEFEIEKPDKKYSMPVETIDAIYLFGEIRINSKLVNFLAQKRIPVHFFNYYGNHTSTLLPHAEQLSGELVIRQVKAFDDPDLRLTIAKAFIDAAAHNMLSNLHYYNRRKNDLSSEIEEIGTLKKAINYLTDISALMGIEGNIRKIYYSCWHKWLTLVPENFKRKYHPPDNPVNTLISFLNSLLYTTCVGELYRTALYPGISYLHSPQTRRYSLALDVVEPFKPIIVDRLIFRLFDKKIIKDTDFRKHTNGMLLSNNARKKIIEFWDAQMRTTIHYPSLNRSVSYQRLLRLDCYKLIKFLMEEEPFKPYKISY